MLLTSTHISNAANTQFLLLPLLDEPTGCLLSLNHVLYCDGHDPAPVEMWRIQLLCFNNPSWVVSDLVHRQCGWSGAPCNFHALFNLSVSLAPTWLVYNQVRLTILPSHVLKSSLADGGVATLSGAHSPSSHLCPPDYRTFTANSCIACCRCSARAWLFWSLAMSSWDIFSMTRGPHIGSMRLSSPTTAYHLSIYRSMYLFWSLTSNQFYLSNFNCHFLSLSLSICSIPG